MFTDWTLGVKKTGENTESKEKYPWREIKISVSDMPGYLLMEDFPGLQLGIRLEVFTGRPDSNP